MPPRTAEAHKGKGNRSTATTSNNKQEKKNRSDLDNRVGSTTSEELMFFIRNPGGVRNVPQAGKNKGNPRQAGQGHSPGNGGAVHKKKPAHPHKAAKRREWVLLTPFYADAGRPSYPRSRRERIEEELRNAGQLPGVHMEGHWEFIEIPRSDPRRHRKVWVNTGPLRYPGFDGEQLTGFLVDRALEALDGIRRRSRRAEEAARAQAAMERAAQLSKKRRLAAIMNFRSALKRLQEKGETIETLA